MWEYHPIFWRTFANDCLDKQDDVTISLLYNVFLDFYEEHIELFEDTLSFLDVCKENYKIALVANGNELRLSRFIRKFHLEQYFDDFVISGETPFKKPDSFMFQYVLKRRSVTPENTLMIGDRYDTDIIGAKNLGIKTVLIRRDQKEYNKNDTNPRYMPDYSVYSLEEVKKLLSKLDKSNQCSCSDVSLTYDIEHPITSALILAGGKGSRLGELGLSTQKCMLPINGKPLLFFMINILKNAGCSNVVIVVDHLAEQIKNYFGTGENFGIKIQYVEDKFISTFEAVYNSLHLLEDTFFYCHGNVVFEERLLEIIWKIYCDTGNSVMAVLKNAYNVTHAKLKANSNNTISDISIKPKDINQQIFDRTFMGVAIYKKESIVQSFDGDLQGMTEKHIISLLNQSIPANIFDYTGNWWHIETTEDYYKVKDKYFWEVNFA
jgi:FMN phosphatase YigB (HAD superfamily)/dTDP-glucose pyrophosphorylase